MSIIDYGYISFNKYGEELCGDTVSINDDGKVLTLVLADGMGSGIKASILSTLTAKILNTMITNNVDIEESVETLIDTLPIDLENGLAYSTFSIINIDLDGKGVLYEFDNPKYIYMRDNVPFKLEEEEFEIYGKRIVKVNLDLKDGDYLLLMSDGVVYAGSQATLNLSFSKEVIVDYLKNNVDKDMSARQIANVLAKACDELYVHEPSDDTSVAVIKKKERKEVSIMIGPPRNFYQDDEYVKEFMKSDSYKIVCGGSTSKLVLDRLKEDIIYEKEDDLKYPPYGYSESIDIICEGLLTLKRVVNLSKKLLDKDYSIFDEYLKNDAASKISEILFEKASDIKFYIGHGINMNHVGLFENDDKFMMINELITHLRKMNKNVQRFDY